MVRTVIPVSYQNPHASMGMTLDLDVIENTPSEVLERNTRQNSIDYPQWLQCKESHSGASVLIGGGCSINDHVEDIKALQNQGATVFAMNGASRWARSHGIHVDYQVILDAKEESAALVDINAGHHLFASQCDAKTLKKSQNLTLWHLVRPDIEDLLPADRVKEGGYALVGGDSSVGVCALCIAYILGFRELHLFGYDTSHRDGNSHGYRQQMNDTMPTMTWEWAGKPYQVSIALKEQCRNLIEYTQALQGMECNIKVWGDGLFPAIYRADANNLSEQDKYRLMWMFSGYRQISPGENVANFYMEKFKPEGRIIDFGCGTGRASIKFKEAGLEPLLLDFADNCRDDDALGLPFMICDLTKEIPIHETHGFCTDVMEHIPTADVDTVIRNIMGAADNVFFQISTVDDACGEAVGAVLHHTVKPHTWWKKKFDDYTVEYAQNLGIASLFYVSQ